MSEKKIRNTWIAMKQRCYYTKGEKYKTYGAKGISVCKEWKNDFKSFLLWSVNNGFKDGLTLDRIDNDGDYTPLNCRWTTSSIQARNTKKIRKNNKSGYRGVCKKGDKWRANIMHGCGQIHLGVFEYPYTAGYVYDSYVIKNNLEHTKNFME